MHRAMMCVKEFHEKFDIPINDVPHLPDKEVVRKRMKLLEDQYHEYRYAERGKDLTKVTDALADMVYVICGTAHYYGIPLDKVFAEVHRSNMTKDGKDENGKVLKGEHFSPPEIAEILLKRIYGTDDF